MFKDTFEWARSKWTFVREFFTDLFFFHICFAWLITSVFILIFGVEWWTMFPAILFVITKETLDRIFVLRKLHLKDLAEDVASYAVGAILCFVAFGLKVWLG